MGERRMVSRRIVETAKFLKLDATARLLYYDLIVRADDDGVVEAFPVIKLTSADEKDLQALEAAGFIKIMNDDLVSYIMKWKEHNWIRKDRKTDSVYKSLLLETFPDIDLVSSSKEPPESTACQSDGCHMSDIWQSNDSQVSVTCQPNDGISKDKLREDKLSQDKSREAIKEKKQSKEKFTSSESLSDPDVSGNAEPCQCSPAKSTRFVKPSLEDVAAYCRERRNSVSAEAFMAFYESNGWKVGRNPMKDWKAAVRTWEQRERADGRSARKEQIDPQYLNDEFETDTLEASNGRWH